MNDNLKPFDVNEWRQTKRKVVTEQGYEVDIIHIDDNLINPIVGIIRDYPDINGKPRDFVNQWDLDGDDYKCYKPNTLYFIPSKETKYVAMSKTANSLTIVNTFDTKREAEVAILATPQPLILGELSYEV